MMKTAYKRYSDELDSAYAQLDKVPSELFILPGDRDYNALYEQVADKSNPEHGWQGMALTWRYGEWPSPYALAAAKREYLQQIRSEAIAQNCRILVSLLFPVYAGLDKQQRACLATAVKFAFV